MMRPPQPHRPEERAEALTALHALATGAASAHPFFEGYTQADAITALDMLD